MKIGWIVAMVAAAFAGAGRAHAQGGGPLGRLRERYPDAGVYEVNGRVQGVFGAPMTRGETADAAAAAFVADHGDVFADELDLRPLFRIPIKRGTKVVFGYMQRVEGLAVEGSVARIAVHDTSEPGSRRWAVVYAAGHMANPELPLLERLVSGPQALQAAQAHALAAGLTQWEAPEESLLWDRTEGPDAAVRTWKIVGSRAALRAAGSWSFFIDARTGSVRRVVDNVFRCSSIPGTQDTTITGTVTGWATPGLLPDPYGEGCEENNPVEVALPHVLVQSIHNGDVYDSGYTDANGDYSISVPNEFSGEVRALLVGFEWAVTDWRGQTFANPPPYPPQNLEHNCVIALPTLIEEEDPGSVVDFEFNSSSYPECDTREFCTACVNAFLIAALNRTYLYDHIPFDGDMPCLTLFANNGDEYFQCKAQWAGTTESGAISLGVVPAQEDCANFAYSTIITHEFGHHVHGALLGYLVGNAFHEGAADTWSMFVHDTPVIGQDSVDCSSVQTDLSTATEVFPDCSNDSHVRGRVLGRAWWDIYCGLGTECGEALEAARDLHAAWVLLATGDQEPPATSSCPSTLQSAGPFTLVEVLTADDDDENLGNGTENEDVICAAFAARNIYPPPGYSVCDDGPTPRCAADCDHSTGVGVLDTLDFVCFWSRFQRGDARACGMDRSSGPVVCDVFDLLAFQNAYAEGCR